MVPVTSVYNPILVVDRDTNFTSFMRSALEEAGYHVLVAHDGETAIAEARKNPSLIFINTDLPILDGWRTVALLKNSQSTAPIPVIFLADVYAESDEVLSFELGGINYLVKPIAPKVIVARIKNLLNGRPAGHVNPVDHAVIRSGELEINPGQLAVKAGGKYIALTRKEFSLLMFLVRNRDMVVDRRTIYREVWGKNLQSGNRNVDVVILRLRDKLGGIGDKIKTISSVGYKFES